MLSPSAAPPDAGDSSTPRGEVTAITKRPTRWERISQRVTLMHVIVGAAVALTVGGWTAHALAMQYKDGIKAEAASALKEHASRPHEVTATAAAAQEARILVLETERKSDAKTLDELRQDVRAIMRHLHVPPPAPAVP